MIRTTIISVLILLAASSLFAREPEFSLDSNTAFYEGEALNYTWTAPTGYRLSTDMAKFDGYSFAFVPFDQAYDSAEIIIGVHIYKIRGMSFAEAVQADTVAVRSFYGPNLILNPIDSIINATNHTLTAFYVDDKTRFIPNVMMSYFNGEAELIVMELVIRPGVLRVSAEDSFVESISKFRALKIGDISTRQ